MTIDKLLREALTNIRERGCTRLDAEVILGHILGKDRVYLHVHGDMEVGREQEASFQKAMRELAQGKPLHYITGSKEWMGLDFLLDENVLIPREDTRILLEEILKLKAFFKKPIIIEIGTGSGILPVLLKKEWQEAEVHTTEIDERTLAKARANFDLHQVQVKSHHCDFLEAIISKGIHGDILFSNPPYISEEEYEELEDCVKNEPYGALVGGADGLEYYRRMALECPQVLKDGGTLLVEIGWKQAAAVRGIFEAAGLTHLKTVRDDGDRDRVVIMENRKR